MQAADRGRLLLVCGAAQAACQLSCRFTPRFTTDRIELVTFFTSKRRPTHCLNYADLPGIDNKICIEDVCGESPAAPKYGLYSLEKLALKRRPGKALELKTTLP